MSDWNEREDDATEDDADAGFVGGGGPASTIYGDDEADAHGDALDSPDVDLGDENA